MDNIFQGEVVELLSSENGFFLKKCIPNTALLFLNSVILQFSNHFIKEMSALVGMKKSASPPQKKCKQWPSSMGKVIEFVWMGDFRTFYIKFELLMCVLIELLMWHFRCFFNFI